MIDEKFRPKAEVKTKVTLNVSEVVIEKWYAVYVEDYDKKDVTRYRNQISSMITKGGDKVKSASYVHEKCIECGRANHAHGWIGNFFTGEKVCPGDYIMKHKGVITKITPKAFEILFGDTTKVKELIVDKTGQMALL